MKLIMQYDEYFEKYLESPATDEITVRIKELLEVSDGDILKSVLEKKLDTEFNGQVCNIYSDMLGEIQLQIKGQDMAITMDENHVKELKGEINLRTEAVYLDDPLVLDELQLPYVRYESKLAGHRECLKDRILYDKKETNVIEEIVVNRKFENIYEKISEACDGDIVRNKHAGLGYKKKSSDKILDVRNLSTGLKMFTLLKTLLQKGIIEYQGTIILDEPEIHLHPEWQLQFAELIILLHKEFQMHILLNTHSPYFLRAIQVYSAKYEIADQCKYYLSEAVGDYAKILDVTDSIEKIYFKLSQPLQKLEDERWQDD